jgi:hypothetical protein
MVKLAASADDEQDTIEQRSSVGIGKGRVLFSLLTPRSLGTERCELPATN